MKLAKLALGYKVAVTLFLVNVLLAFFFAYTHLRYTVQYRDGEAGISFTDLRIFFSGDPTNCRLETMIAGPMRAKFASPDERETVEQWIADGAPEQSYPDVEPIFKARCIRCHGPGGEKSEAPLTSFDEVTSFTQTADTGIEYPHLAQLSLISMAVMTALSALVVWLFYLSRFRGAWKEIVALLTFAAIFCNVLSWWSAKQSAAFIHIIVGSGVLLAALILLMAVLVFLDLWILPEEREEG